MAVGPAGCGRGSPSARNIGLRPRGTFLPRFAADPDLRLEHPRLLNLPLASDGGQVDMVLHELVFARSDRKPA